MLNTVLHFMKTENAKSSTMQSASLATAKPLPVSIVFVEDDVSHPNADSKECPPRSSSSSAMGNPIELDPERSKAIMAKQQQIHAFRSSLHHNQMQLAVINIFDSKQLERLLPLCNESLQICQKLKALMVNEHYQQQIHSQEFSLEKTRIALIDAIAAKPSIFTKLFVVPVYNLIKELNVNAYLAEDDLAQLRQDFVKHIESKLDLMTPLVFLSQDNMFSLQTQMMRWFRDERKLKCNKSFCCFNSNEFVLRNYDGFPVAMLQQWIRELNPVIPYIIAPPPLNAASSNPEQAPLLGTDATARHRKRS